MKLEDPDQTPTPVDPDNDVDYTADDYDPATDPDSSVTTGNSDH
jgi:hypothetical protein